MSWWYLIGSTESEGDWWSNANGWVSFATATPFTSEDLRKVNLPIGGKWVEWSKQGLKTVDVTNDTQTEVDKALHS